MYNIYILALEKDPIIVKIVGKLKFLSIEEVHRMAIYPCL